VNGSALLDATRRASSCTRQLGISPSGRSACLLGHRPVQRRSTRTSSSLRGPRTGAKLPEGDPVIQLASRIPSSDATGAPGRHERGTRSRTRRRVGTTGASARASPALDPGRRLRQHAQPGSRCPDEPQVTNVLMIVVDAALPGAMDLLLVAKPDRLNATMFNPLTTKGPRRCATSSRTTS